MDLRERATPIPIFIPSDIRRCPSSNPFELYSPSLHDPAVSGQVYDRPTVNINFPRSVTRSPRRFVQ